MSSGAGKFETKMASLRILNLYGVLRYLGFKNLILSPEGGLSRAQWNQDNFSLKFQ